ncbi:hypothetical protein ACWA7J_16470 [Leptothrix sp. BB-4]
MSVSLNPVEFETNIPGMALSNVTAAVADLAPVAKNELIVDINHAIEVTMRWDQTGTSPWTDFFLDLAGATWHLKATLKPVDGGASVPAIVTSAFAGGPGMRTVQVQFPANTLAVGTYELFVTCHLKSASNVHLATSMLSSHRVIELFQSVMV